MTEAQEEQLRSVTRPESFSFQDEQFDLFRHRFSPILTTQHRTAVSECPPTNPSADFTDEIGVAVVRATLFLSIDAILYLIEQHNITPKQVQSVRVGIPPLMVMPFTQPEIGLPGKFSVS